MREKIIKELQEKLKYYLGTDENGNLMLPLEYQPDLNVMADTLLKLIKENLPQVSKCGWPMEVKSAEKHHQKILCMLEGTERI